MNFVANVVAKVFGTKSGRDIKETIPLVEEINQYFQTLGTLSDEDLRAKTGEFKQFIAEGLSQLDHEIQELNQKIEANPDLDIHEKEEIFNLVDKLEESRNDRLEEVLLELPRLCRADIGEREAAPTGPGSGCQPAAGSV